MSNITTSEIIATLQRSNAPTLIVEGNDDYVALEQFENENVDWGLTIFPVNGKEIIFEIFRRRNELKNNNIIFLMDKDCWVFEGIPEEYNKDNVVYTDGYSIENDLIRDGQTWRIFSAAEKSDFERCLKFLSRFIAAASHHHVSGTTHYPLSTHPRRVFPGEYKACPDIENWLLNVEPEVPAPFLETYNDPYKFVRGKSLLALIVMFLSHEDRSSKYSNSNILELGARARGEFLRRIERAVLHAFVAIGCLDENVERQRLG